MYICIAHANDYILWIQIILLIESLYVCRLLWNKTKNTFHIIHHVELYIYSCINNSAWLFWNVSIDDDECGYRVWIYTLLYSIYTCVYVLPPSSANAYTYIIFLFPEQTFLDYFAHKNAAKLYITSFIPVGFLFYFFSLLYTIYCLRVSVW